MAREDGPWKDQLLGLLDWLCGFLNCPGATVLSTTDFESQVEAFVRMAEDAEVPPERTGPERALAAWRVESARLITAEHAGEMPSELAWSLELRLAELDALLSAPGLIGEGMR